MNELLSESEIAMYGVEIDERTDEMNNEQEEDGYDLPRAGSPLAFEQLDILKGRSRELFMRNFSAHVTRVTFIIPG